MTIAICDDSAIDCLLSKFLISEYFKKHRKTCDIVTYETGAKLISDFEDGAVFDIVFMDIYVGEELGIDIAGRLRNEGYDNLLIFSTITPEYAIAMSILCTATLSISKAAITAVYFTLPMRNIRFI